MSRRVVVHPNQEVLAAAAAARVLTALIDLQSQTAPVHWVLTGGTVGIGTLAQIKASPVVAAVDWSNVHIWWGDERFVPAGHPDRNEVQAREALLDHLVAEYGLPQSNIHPIAPAESSGISTAEDAAQAYCAELAQFAGDGEMAAPNFDLLLLGMGPDIHVASLFPGHDALAVTDHAAVAVHDSPKPPPTRVSLTLKTINQAKQVWIVAGGAEKADAVQAVLAGNPVTQAPAAGVAGSLETLLLLDADAAR